MPGETAEMESEAALRRPESASTATAGSSGTLALRHHPVVRNFAFMSFCLSLNHATVGACLSYAVAVLGAEKGAFPGGGACATVMSGRTWVGIQRPLARPPLPPQATCRRARCTSRTHPPPCWCPPRWSSGWGPRPVEAHTRAASRPCAGLGVRPADCECPSPQSQAALVCATAAYTAYVGSFVYASWVQSDGAMLWVVLVAAAVVGGFAAGVLFTAQGKYLGAAAAALRRASFGGRGAGEAAPQSYAECTSLLARHGAR